MPSLISRRAARMSRDARKLTKAFDEAAGSMTKAQRDIAWAFGVPPRILGFGWLRPVPVKPSRRQKGWRRRART